MARPTQGVLKKEGNRYKISYQVNGKRFRYILRDENGKAITSEAKAKKAAAVILNLVTAQGEENRLRIVHNELQNLESRVQKAERVVKNQSAPVAAGWRLFMECPKRPVSCRRYTIDTIPQHTTAANYRSYYDRFFGWIHDNYPEATLLCEVTGEIAAAFMEHIQHTQSSGTFNKYLQFFNCFYTVLIEAGKISTENPFRGVDRMLHRYNSKKPLSREQVEQLITAADGELKLVIAAGYYFGLRLGDCCTLTWDDIFMDRHVIERIARKIKDRVKDISEAIVKMGIPAEMYDMLSATPPEQRQGYIAPKLATAYLAGRDEWINEQIQKLFHACNIATTRPGTGIKLVIDPKTGAKKRIGTRAVVEYGFHSLRYSYISHNAEAGTPAAVIQRNAGHANPAMTEHYTRISDAAAIKYAQALSLAQRCDVPPDEVAERQHFRELADTLPIERIREFLQNNAEN